MTDEQKYKKSLDIIASCVLPVQVEIAEQYLRRLWGDSWSTVSDVYILASDPRPVCKVRQKLDHQIDFIESEVRLVPEGGDDSDKDTGLGTACEQSEEAARDN